MLRFPLPFLTLGLAWSVLALALLPATVAGQACSLAPLLDAAAVAPRDAASPSPFRKGTCSHTLLSGGAMPRSQGDHSTGYQLSSVQIPTTGNDAVSFCTPRCERGYRLRAPRSPAGLQSEWDGYACFAGAVHYFHSASSTASSAPLRLDRADAASHLALRCEPLACALHDHPEQHLCLQAAGDDACSTSLESGESCAASCLPGYKLAPRPSSESGPESLRISCSMGNVSMPVCVRRAPSEGFCDLRLQQLVPEHQSLRTSVLSCLAPRSQTCPPTGMLEHGSECSHECMPGYNLEPPQSRLACRSDGTVQLVDEEGNVLPQKQQSCVPVSCMVPELPAGAARWEDANTGKHLKLMVKHGANISLVCREGFSLLPKSAAAAHESGPPADATVARCDKGTFHPSLSRAQCYKVCLASSNTDTHGTWICGTDAEGHDIPCPGDERKVVLPGATATLRCDHGFTTEGQKKRTRECGLDGKFLPGGVRECSPQCRPPALSKGVRGYSLVVRGAGANSSEISCPDVVSSGQSCRIRCTPGFSLPQGLNREAECRRGEWHPAFPPHCMPLCRLPPSYLVHGTWMCRQSAKDSGSRQECLRDEVGAVVRPHETARLHCDTGYSLAASESGTAGDRTCGSSGQWRGATPPLSVSCHPQCAVPNVPRGRWMCGPDKPCPMSNDAQAALLLPQQIAWLACAFPAYPFGLKDLSNDRNDESELHSVVCGLHGQLLSGSATAPSVSQLVPSPSAGPICVGASWMGCVSECARRGKCCSTAKSVCTNRAHCCHECPRVQDGAAQSSGSKSSYEVPASRASPALSAFSSRVIPVPGMKHCLMDTASFEMHCFAIDSADTPKQETKNEVADSLDDAHSEEL